MKITFFILFTLLISINTFAKDKVTLEADTISSLDNATSIAEGNVIILYKSMTLTTDKLKFNRQTNEVEAFGNVILNDNDSNFNADYIYLDMDNNTGTLTKSSGFYPPYTFIEADNITKKSDKIYLLENAQITSCKGSDDSKPDWSIKTSDAKFEKGEYVQAKHATFRIKDVPVLYSPYFVWPVKEKRESGFLIPEFGSSSSKGEFINPRYFLDLGVDKDITFGVNLFTQIETQYLTELRYAKSKKENIYLSGEYIHHTDSESDKIDRWKFVNTSNIFITDNLELKFDTNYVSDFRYEREFNEYSIYSDENTDDDDTKNDYINEIRLNYYSDYANISLRYRDDMEYTDISGGYKQTHIIRSPNLIVEKNNIPLWLIKFNYKADYNKLVSKKRTFYFAENEGENDTINDDNFHQERLHGRLKFYTPLNIMVGTFTPAYTQYLTRWFNMNDDYQVDNTRIDTTASITQSGNTIDRLIYKVDLNFTLNEIYKRYSIFKHSIYNTYSYSYIPDVDQGNIPSLIEEDKISEKEIHTYKMKNYFNSEKWSTTLEFSQQYNALLEEENFLPFRTKLKFSLWDSFSGDIHFTRDHYEKNIPYMNNKLSFRLNNLYIGTEYIYDENLTSDDNNNVKVALGVKLFNFDILLSETASMASENLALHPLHKYENKTFESEIKYTSGCWGVGVNYKHKNYIKVTNSGNNRETEEIYFLYVELKGLGNTNQQVYNN